MTTLPCSGGTGLMCAFHALQARAKNPSFVLAVEEPTIATFAQLPKVLKLGKAIETPKTTIELPTRPQNKPMSPNR